MTTNQLYKMLESIPELSTDEIVKLTWYAFFNPVANDLSKLWAPAGSEAQKIIELVEEDDCIRYFFQLYMLLNFIRPFQPPTEWCFETDSEVSSWDYLMTRLVKHLSK